MSFSQQKNAIAKRWLLLLFIGFSYTSQGQFAVGMHCSNLPFAGFSYEIKSRLRPELRIGVDTYFEDLSVEGVLCYDLADKDGYEVYAGLGGRINAFAGLVVPVGLNVYPFPEKRLGFQLELAPIFGEANLLRGSSGLRYRF